ncbi:MAG: TonB-dependent receptor, partial [Bacteroidota bacterium]
QLADGTVEVQVANTVLAASSSVAEIFARTPDVRIDEDGALTIVGKGDAQLYLNGQPITAGQLATIPPANILKIAVIRNPPARYDASGGAVIEITTTKGLDDGYRVTLQQNLGTSNFGGEQSYSAINLNANRGRFAMNANYSVLQGDDRHVKFTTRNRSDPDIFLSSRVNIDWQHQLRGFHQYGLGLQYQAARGSTLSLAYSGFLEDLGGNTFNTNLLVDSEETLDYASTIFVDQRDQNNTLSLNYTKALDSLGSSLFFGGQITDFTGRSDNPISEMGITAAGSTARRLRNLAGVGASLLSAQMDYQKVLSNQSQLELGLRYGEVINEADLDFFISEGFGPFTLSSDLSSVYRYREGVAAAYANYSGQFSPKLSFSAGLRAEWTDYDLSLAEADPTPLRDAYLNLFPTASLNWQMADDRSLSFNYTARIRRPPFQSLNPNLIYQDPYTSIQGNPELVPEKIHAVEVVGKAGATVVKLGYAFTFDPLSGGAIRGDDPRSYILKRLNFSEQFEWYAAASRRFELGPWTSNNTLSFSYAKASSFEFSFASVDPRIQPYFFTDNRFRIKDWFTFELTFWYNGVLREGTFTRYDSANLTLGVERSILEDKLKARFIVADLFNTVRASGDYRLGETDIYFDNKWRSSYSRIALTYHFGELRKAKYTNKAAGAVEEGRIR